MRQAFAQGFGAALLAALGALAVMFARVGLADHLDAGQTNHAMAVFLFTLFVGGLCAIVIAVVLGQEDTADA